MPEAAAAVRNAAQADFTFQAGELTTQDLRVVGFTGDEGLSQLFEFQVDIASDDSAITAESMLAKPCMLEIAGSTGSRFVHGMICRFERTGQGRRQTFYSATVVPVHWLLTKRIRSRIFQEHICSDMTVPGIIKKVFADAGIATDTYRTALSATYTAREYVVQYRESEFDFISRLMEEEGIFYFFEHTAAGHKMVIADSGVAHVAATVDGECTYREPTGLVAERESLFALRESAEIQIGATRLKDFDFVKPAVNISGNSAGDAFKALEFSDFPGNFLETADATRLSKIRLEEQQCRRRVLRMSGNVRGLSAGVKFTLVEHPVDAFNREYLVTHVSQRANQPQGANEEAGGEAPSYEVDLRVIPSDVPFRAPRGTRRPRIAGTQTAMVVGTSGEEIYTDKYGRVKVQFHWDLEGQYNENSSCFIRVSQGFAGGQYGMMFLPRVGQEVVVDFLEGDPDRPLIVGRVYNNNQMPAYTLPDNKTRSYIKTNSSTGGGGTNEIMFEDKKDSEKILLFAQKDMHVRVTNDRVENVDHNHYITVKEQSFELVKQKKHSEVKLDLNEKVGGKHSHEVTGDYGMKAGGNFSIEGGGSTVYIKAAQNLVLEGTSGVTLKCGGNFIKLEAAGVSIQGTLTKINSGGAPGTGTAVALTAPEATIEADTATPGADVTYSATAVAAEALAPETKAYTPAELPPVEEVVESWVEIEMVDETGQPWRGEYYEVTRADGKVIKGYLNDLGQAHIYLPKAEQAQVSFPKLDAEAWEKL